MDRRAILTDELNTENRKLADFAFNRRCSPNAVPTSAMPPSNGGASLA